MALPGKIANRARRLGSIAAACLTGVGLWAGMSLGGARADPFVDTMGDSFVGKLPAGWTAAKGDWQYFDFANCWNSGNCFGNNPTSPYGYPRLPAGNGLSSVFQMNPNDAVVIFMRTPPRMRYFGFTQYLFSRPGYVYPLFASLSDPLNIEKFIARNSPVVGKNDLNRFAVLVWTADLNTLETMKSTLRRMNIDGDNVNFMPLPINLPLFMGIGGAYDTFSLMMRMAVPRSQANLDAYMAEKPFYVLKVTRDSVGPTNPAPTAGYASEISGVVEDPGLQTALNNLVADIKAHYAKRFVFTPQTVTYKSSKGLDCIALNQACSGDNHDNLYSTDSATVQVVNTNDIFIVAGVNHHRTGKVLYSNIAVIDPAHNAGVAAIDDTDLTTQSALYHAGVRSYGDPRGLEYRYLYAYAISYDCGGLQYCLQIPAPTAGNPVGLAPGAPFTVASRSYVDRITTVRPSPTEIVTHQPLLGTRK